MARCSVRAGYLFTIDHGNGIIRIAKRVNAEDRPAEPPPDLQTLALWAGLSEPCSTLAAAG